MTAGWLLVRGKIHLWKVEHPRFEGYLTPNEDECQKSAQLKYIHCQSFDYMHTAHWWKR